MQELTNGQLENIPCTNKTHKIILLIMHVYFSKLTTFLWIILIRQPGRSSLLLEIVIINFGGPMRQGQRANICGRGSRVEKNKYPLLGSIFCDSLLIGN